MSLDPQMWDDGSCTCPRCDGNAEYHKHPHYKSVDIDCEECGKFTIPEDFDPDEPDRPPRHYGGTLPADPEVNDDDPF